MFFNLVYRNAMRSRKENLIYFFTLVTAVASFYIILSLGRQDVILYLKEFESDAVNKLLTLMPIIYLFALFLLFFLVLFANKYQLDRRSREFGLYLILGMQKERLFLQLLAEGLVTSFLAFLGGIVCGGFLAEIISLTTSRLVGQGIIGHHFSFSASAVGWTALGFLLIQSIALFVLGGKLFKQELHQLLYGEMAQKQDMGNARGGIITLVLGAIALGIAYWLVLKCFTVLGGVLLLLAMVFGIVGTLLFIRGLARLLSLLAGSIKSKSTHGLYTFTLRQLQENIVNRYVSVAVASILMMLSIMLIADGSSIIMASGSHLTRETSVYDFTVTGDDQKIEHFLTSEQMKPYVAYLNRLETGTMQTQDKRGQDDLPLSFVDWSTLTKKIIKLLPAGVEDPAATAKAQYSISNDNPAALNLLGAIEPGKSAPYLIPESSYNRLLEAAGAEPLSLKSDEAVLYLNPDFFSTDKSKELSMLDNIFKEATRKKEALITIKAQPIYFIPSVPMRGLVADRSIRIVSALVIPDDKFNEVVNSNTHRMFWNFCIPETIKATEGLMTPMKAVSDLLNSSGFGYESYLNNFGRQLFYVVAGSYTTLYMGFMFLIISCTVLALQFLTQMQQTRRRYLTLSMLGAGREQMKKSMHQQVLWYFLLPMLLACVSGSVGLSGMQMYLLPPIANKELLYVFAAVIACAVILVIGIYAVAVAHSADHEINKLQWKPNAD